MEGLASIHQQYLRSSKAKFKREFANLIDWKDRLIGISGARGVGKTTLLLQHILQQYGYSKEILYVTMDHVQINGISLIQIADFHAMNGGTHLFIDEIHTSADWSIELKTIYDLYTDLHIVFTSSSILEINQGKADLSRRAIVYEMNGLSFREYLQIETNSFIEKYTLDGILGNHTAIAQEILKLEIKPIKYFKEYLTHGYYPFFLEGKSSYSIKLLNTIYQTLDIDLIIAKKIDPVNIPKLKKLIHVLAVSVPFQPNVTKLAGSLEITRNTLLLYLQYLAQAQIINLLQDEGSTYSYLAKPDKILLNNTNLIHCLATNNENKGSIRETFFVNAVKHLHPTNTTSQGDFTVNEKYTFEIGGPSKTTKQIVGVKDSYLVVDDIEIGVKNIIPLWLFGFLE